MTEAERFDDKYIPEPNSGCWLWTGSLNRFGYGKFYARGASWLAHRFSYELRIGPVPEQLHVCHKCDVTQCVNPDHLFLGTHADNMRDKSLKGRSRTGTGDRHGSKTRPDRYMGGPRGDSHHKRAAFLVRLAGALFRVRRRRICAVRERARHISDSVLTSAARGGMA